jgi:serine/threonine protein kinase
MARGGERLGRFRLLERLGEGGMGVIYRARLDGASDCAPDVAIKRLHPALHHLPAFTQKLAEEARLVAALEHPSIVQVLELGRDGDAPFVVMEYVDGVDLAALLRRARALGRPLPLGVVAFLVYEAATALGYAHALGLIHCDVSPANLMVTSAGRTKLLDFGIARVAATVTDERTRTGLMQGKLGYLAPEQAEGLSIDHRVDLFALGVVAHECLTLERLFRGGDDFETLRLVREANVPSPTTWRPQGDAGDEALFAIVMRLLARAPAARFADAAALVEALRPVMHRLGGDAAATRQLLQELSPIATGRAPLPTRTTRPRARRLALAATITAAAAGVTIAWPARHHVAPVSPAPADPVAATPASPRSPEPLPVPVVAAPSPAASPAPRRSTHKRAAPPTTTTTPPQPTVPLSGAPHTTAPPRSTAPAPAHEPADIKNPFNARRYDPNEVKDPFSR